ncbi:site-specific integrase [Thioclava electrotropha]|uniref:Site-specific integrase n=1 Tax=Thioclava electrotropha TaxID=1549850 RepID=A0ABX6YU00_9RHOB|nr:site-specific integrase [Thioclava electrotropha]QPZ91208.1 site-specific integrase [Thioclava electrotropha]
MRATKSQSGRAAPSSPEEFRDAFGRDRPGVDPGPVLRSVRGFSEWRGDMGWPMPVPDRTEISGYLDALSARLGAEYAASELAYIQLGAPVLWGVPVAGMIGQVLRQSRCTPKVAAQSIDERARSAISSLPDEWQGKLIAKLISEPGPHSEKWSANHVQSVAHALARWCRASAVLGREVRPSGSSFHVYATDLRADGVSDRSVSDYLSRIVSAFRVVADPGFRSAGCDHVIARHDGLAKVAGRPTKTGAQIVGASTIFDLGVELMDTAREKGPRGLHVARDFRNGLLLSFAAALPQRARALSHLSFGTTVMLLEKPYVHVVLPGRVLKMREAKKRFAGYDKVLCNSMLWSALDDYKRSVRPLFDEGPALFPSMIDMGAAITSAQLGRLVGDLTCKHLGVRVSIHRVRDNAATEASEEIQSGGYLAPALLGNKSAGTTRDSYDHAQGMRAAREHGARIAGLRSAPTTLRV